MIVVVGGCCLLVLFLVLSELAREGSETAYVLANIECWTLMLLGTLGIGASFAFAIVGPGCESCEPGYTSWSANHIVYIGVAVVGVFAFIAVAVLTGKRLYRVASASMILAAALWVTWAALVWERLGI